MDELIGSTLAKAVLWLVPVIFGAGGMYASFQRTGADVAKMEATIEANEKSLEDHVGATFGHSGARERVIKIETNQQQIMVRQQRAAENIAAICQATGASCR